jgi:hypothetical protein
MSHASADAFSEPLDHTDALYLTITVLSTVGFRDIILETVPARIITGLQMLLGLGFLAAIVRLLARAARLGCPATHGRRHIVPGRCRAPVLGRMLQRTR